MYLGLTRLKCLMSPLSLPMSFKCSSTISWNIYLYFHHCIQCHLETASYHGAPTSVLHCVWGVLGITHASALFQKMIADCSLWTCFTYCQVVLVKWLLSFLTISLRAHCEGNACLGTVSCGLVYFPLPLNSPSVSILKSPNNPAPLRNPTQRFHIIHSNYFNLDLNFSF